MQNLVTRKTKTYILATSVVFSLFSTSSCSNKSSPLVPTEVIDQNAVSQKPTNFVVFKEAKVDILFVVDNSTSMDTVQTNIARNAVRFSTAITQSPNLDYHIGVIAADMTNGFNSGKLHGFPKFITKTTPNAADLLARNIALGTNNSVYTETFYDPIIAAITPPLTNNENKNFLRDDATLAIIFITDAGEQSRMTTNDFFNTLVNIKKSKDKILAYAAMLKLGSPITCIRPDTPNDKLDQFLSLVVNANSQQTNILDLCLPDYGDKLAEFAQDIVSRTSSTIYLNKLPLIETIKVSYGTQIIPNSYQNGWVYVPNDNSIFLSPDTIFIEQTPKPELLIEYKEFAF